VLIVIGHFLYLKQTHQTLKQYDVIIVGAGPAGLRCAEILSTSSLSVLVLEKNPIVGDKVCAGGITRKGFQIFDIPDDIIEQKVDEVKLHSPHYSNHKYLPEPVMYTVHRHAFGKWQMGRLKDTAVEIRLNARVTKINEQSVTLDNKQEFGFRYLVGGDGVNSIVRKYLELPVEDVLATVQYIVPVKGQSSCMEIFLDSKYFHSWYGWIFPHDESIAIGACCDARDMSGKKLKENVLQWLNDLNIDITEAKYESYPISYDYRGVQFGNVFLIGEAAGLASGLTGEGILQSLVSGEEVANRILDKGEHSEAFRFVLKYNDIQHKFLWLFRKAGPLRTVIADLLILFMRNGWVNRKISKGFS
jgi:geranylgeranyl reductase